MERSIPYSICSKITKPGDRSKNKSRYRIDTQKTKRTKRIEITEAKACPDDNRKLIGIAPNYSVSEIKGYLKGKRRLMILDRHANLK